MPLPYTVESLFEVYEVNEDFLVAFYASITLLHYQNETRQSNDVTAYKQKIRNIGQCKHPQRPIRRMGTTTTSKGPQNL